MGEGHLRGAFLLASKGREVMDVLVDALGELASQIVGGVVKVALIGLGMIAALATALIVRVKKNKKE